MFALALVGLLGVVGATLNAAGVTGRGHLSAQMLQREIGQALANRTGVAVSVRCPAGDEPLRKGRISDCIATAPGEPSYYVRVTQDDGEGHYTWELTSQRAPGP